MVGFLFNAKRRVERGGSPPERTSILNGESLRGSSEENPKDLPGRPQAQGERERCWRGLPRTVRRDARRFLEERLAYFGREGTDYIQGQSSCPFCGDLVNYRWSRFGGWLELECGGGCFRKGNPE